MADDEAARAALEKYRRVLNKAVYGTPEPTMAQYGERFDSMYGLWLPADLVKPYRAEGGELMPEPAGLHPNWWARAFVEEIYRRLLGEAEREEKSDVAHAEE